VQKNASFNNVHPIEQILLISGFRWNWFKELVISHNNAATCINHMTGKKNFTM